MTNDYDSVNQAYSPTVEQSFTLASLNRSVNVATQIISFDSLNSSDELDVGKEVKKNLNEFVYNVAKTSKNDNIVLIHCAIGQDRSGAGSFHVTSLIYQNATDKEGVNLPMNVFTAPFAMWDEKYSSQGYHD